jgi:hypothetical protein
MELTLIIANAALGLACLALMLRNLRFMRAIAQARTDRGVDTALEPADTALEPADAAPET